MLKILKNSLDWIVRSQVRVFILIFFLSFIVKSVLFLNLVQTKYILPHTRWEIEAIAVSLAQTGEFANPYALPTGPTAHLPPIYPGIIGLIYYLFGLTLTAGYINWLLRIVFYSLIYAILPWLAREFGLSKQAGMIGGIAGALILEWPSYVEAPTAVVLALLLVLFLRRWIKGHYTLSSSFLLGLVWGVAFHLQPALLPVFLGCMLFELWYQKDNRKWQFSFIIILGVFLVCIPWGLRNYLTFQEIFFIRSNLGLELRMGNHEGAAAAMDVMDRQKEPRHPRTHLEEAQKMAEVGEMEYMHQAKKEALNWIRNNPLDFIWLSGKRMIHFWFGPLYDPIVAFGITILAILAFLGIWQMFPALLIPQRAVLLIPLITFPLIYYVVPYMYRYTVPINWMLLMLAGAVVWRWLERR